MRIIQFIDTRGFGGAERMLVELCSALRQQGEGVECWHFGNAWLASRLSELGVPHRALGGMRSYKSAVTLPWFWRRAAGLLRHSGSEVLHTHLLGAGFAWSVPARAAGVTHVATLHDAYSLRGSGRSRTMISLATRLGTRLVGVSPEICASAGRWIRSGTVPLVLNGISPPRTSPDVRATVRNRLGVGASEVVFTTVGRLVGVKRHDLMIRPFLERSLPETARLWVVGDGPLKEQYQAEVDARSGAGRVRFLGESDEVANLLAASDVQLSASDSEGLPMALIEGLGAGLPIIATAVGGTTAIVEDQKNGITVPAGDSAALGAAVARLAREPGTRAAMASESARRFDQRFRSSAMAAQYRALYGQAGA